MTDVQIDLDAPWEPWTPKVGDRVRVRLSGECKGSGHDIGHSVANGFTGTVVNVETPEMIDLWNRVAVGLLGPQDCTHRIRVKMRDKRHWIGEGYRAYEATFNFAVIELEPLEGEPS